MALQMKASIRLLMRWHLQPEHGSELHDRRAIDSASSAMTTAPSRRSGAPAWAEWRITLRDECWTEPKAQVAA
jgi:hypothetical protein